MTGASRTAPGGLAGVALAALCVTVFAVPWEEAVVLEGVGSVARLVGFAAALLGLLSLLEPGRVRLRPPSLLLVVTAAYTAWLALSYFWTVDTDASREGLTTMVQLLLLVWLVWQLCQDARARNAVLQSLVLGATVVAVNVLWVFLFRPDTIRIDGRIASAGENQNEVATILALAMGVAWWLVTQRRGPLSTVFNLAFLGLAPFALVLTGSRSGVLLTLLVAAQLPLAAVRLRGSVRVGLVVAVAAAVTTLALLPPDLAERALPNMERISTLGHDLTQSDFTGRAEIWHGGWLALIGRPAFGYGNNAFRAAVRPILGNGWAPHNAFLAVAVGTGLVGLALYVAALALTLLAQFIAPPSPARLARIFLFLTLVVAMLPKGSAYDKSTWLLLALLTCDVGPALLARAAPRRLPAREVAP
ncbi:MAG: O-antigen ligase family protein [Trueperaceae bacterium]|nr:O-antigen ligase family protein [Trueperaceae bacterium]